MDARAQAANEFFVVTQAEVIPFVSDEATWWDLDYLDTVELATAIEAHYGVVLDVTKLALPFWQLLDFVATCRTRTQAGG